MKGNSNKDVAEEMRVLTGLGWTYEGIAGDGHHVFFHPDFGKIRLPGSPSNWRWRPAYRQKLARLMGITKGELEVRLGERAPKAKKSTRKKRRRRQDKPARVFEVAPAFKPRTQGLKADPLPDDPSCGITEARRRAWQERQEELARAVASQPFPWRESA